jgi:hypothetical protein
VAPVSPVETAAASEALQQSAQGSELSDSRGAGAPSLLPKHRQALIDLVRAGRPYSIALALRRVPKSTGYGWLKDDEEFQADIFQARAEAGGPWIDDVANSKQGPGQKDAKARMWLLSHWFPDTFKMNPETLVQVNTDNSVSNVAIALTEQDLADIRELRALAGRGDK